MAVPRCLIWLAVAPYRAVQVTPDGLSLTRRGGKTTDYPWTRLALVEFHRGNRIPELATWPDPPKVTVVNRDGRESWHKLLVIAPDTQDLVAAALARECASHDVEYREEALPVRWYSRRCERYRRCGGPRHH